MKFPFAFAGVFLLTAFAQAAMVKPNPDSPLKNKKVMVLEGGSISTDHLSARTATWTNLQAMATSVGFAISKGDPKTLTDANLANIDIMVFNYFFETQMETSFPTASKNAFKKWLQKGGKGYVGYHTSGANQYFADTTKAEWLWYQDNVTSMRYALHGSGTPDGKVVKTTDAATLALPIMQGLPDNFTAADEWYEYEKESKLFTECKVMYNLSNAADIARAPNPNHPVAWFREDAVKSRYFYATFIHFQDGANSDWFKSIILRALEYTSGDPTTPILSSRGNTITGKDLFYVTSNRTLTVNLPSAYTLSVWSAAGKKLYAVSGEGKQIFTPVAFVKPGLYVVKVDSKAKSVKQKIMIY
jgi:hypothetical protein